MQGFVPQAVAPGHREVYALDNFFFFVALLVAVGHPFAAKRLTSILLLSMII